MTGAIKFDATFDQVSAKYGCQKRTVENTWQRYLSTGSVRDRHIPGRPKICSVRNERGIVRKQKRKPIFDRSCPATNGQLAGLLLADYSKSMVYNAENPTKCQ